jgi:hypothetical protein
MVSQSIPEHNPLFANSMVECPIVFSSEITVFSSSWYQGFPKQQGQQYHVR